MPGREYKFAVALRQLLDRWAPKNYLEMLYAGYAFATLIPNTNVNKQNTYTTRITRNYQRRGPQLKFWRGHSYTNNARHAPHDQVRGRGRGRGAGVWRRVRLKLEGRDTHARHAPHDQVEYIISEATSAENLCLMYEGWMAWV
ncbi:hypothetical protein evm_012776 [Chilo suppressalis]|nr:hypothetical protein evm_012776 [Chilo suppressalis]